MPDLFDTGGVRDDAEHWDALAERVAAAAVGASRGGSFDRFAASRAGWIAASLLLAAGLAFIALQDKDSSGSGLRAVWTQALAPTDDIGRVITSRDSPPAIGALLLGARGEGVR